MKPLRIHYLQHAEFEGLGSIEDWINKNGHQLTCTKLFETDDFPKTSDFDWLIIMGGPMGVYEEDKFHWLNKEKKFIKKAIEEGKTVLGICLGSQLIANSLGALVYKNDVKEIGWFDVEFTQEALENKLFKGINKIQRVFQWHGDTFEIPEGAIRIASSEAAANQGFIYKDKVLALQFHLETNKQSLDEITDNCRKELKPSKYVQSEEEILKNKSFINQNQEMLFSLLDRIQKQ